MTVEELKGLMAELGEKPFRAKQIYSWLHEHLVTSYDEMENIPKSLRQKLEQYPITVLETLDVQISKIDGTRKYLFRLSDGNMIESVLMKYKHGNSVCISLRRGAVWDADSVLPRSADLRETCFRQRCWIRYTESRHHLASVYPMWL